MLAQCPVLKTQLSDQLRVLEEESENLLEKGANVGLNKKQIRIAVQNLNEDIEKICLLYTSPSPRDQRGSRMPSSA